MNIGRMIGGIGLLILVFLVLSRGKETTSILTSLASASTSTIKTLQGR